MRVARSIFAVLDSSVLVAICAGEAGRSDVAVRMLRECAGGGTIFYAPGVIVSEVLYVLCRKLNAGDISAEAYNKAVLGLRTRMKSIFPPPHGDASLIERAEQLREGFGCSRSSDGLYIALAEQMGLQGWTELITFDGELQRQVRRNAPTVNVRVL